jgi:hypothetical protein
MRLLGQTNLLLPGAPEPLRLAFEAAIRRIRDAQERVLDDD